MSEAEVLYGNITPDSSEQMEVGELGLDVWKHNMIVPLKDSILVLLLDEFEKQRHNISMTTSLDIIAGVINSFVVVQEFRKKHPLEVFKLILYATNTIKYILIYISFSYIKHILKNHFWNKVVNTSNVKPQGYYKNVQYLSTWLKYYRY